MHVLCEGKAGGHCLVLVAAGTGDDFSSAVLLYVHRDHKDYYCIREEGAQYGHLDTHTAPEL